MTIDVGTNRYQAPEVVNSSSYGLEADFFSLGSVLYFLVTGHAPFWRKTDAEVELKFASVGSLPEKERFADLNRWIIDQIGFHGLSDGDLKQQMPHVRVAHAWWRDLVHGVLQADPKKRINLDTAEKFLKNIG
eukprot:TRINITY_DN1141_c0_g1_i2.p2 TRINITY_DN1141_c0_g1~~TRINITY_DN1141_c0_g1_i2.p2  ORF type:complete len:133 (+),score=48.72 TRINITY_DN1141_c0_g1_i2:162-560(+)